MEHKFLCGVKKVDDDIFLEVLIRGKLTHEDYERFVPLVENLVYSSKQPKISVLADIRGFVGWELEAMWDDFKFSMKHFMRFDKVAVVGDKKWEEIVIKISNLVTPYDSKFFDEYNDAVEWLRS